ncbi:type I-F CRISPR-associated protein Csy2 [Erwinia pyrifoliae]|uniref:type I-F CRISPR-associated protein Csy2 n=1 Tax=Erwinia pyrifoliae TaxID=79967 RepID=UPI00223ADA0F|nr:type I-F CRISPR-associated protein Csy2 [Erwinia pyrifoliae]MCT2387888.1 type I-F CRISPR-associated protein Csy2 [Erwinia pyrifoliae]MCU8586144.1 type I-F CRISPR-associated protein Csy2 [Erwinia pyrifoliae]
MSALIVLRHLRVENANAVAGLTWGFPAITHFLGFTHALSRKLQQSHNITLSGCGVICHQQQVHAYTSGRDYQFALTRNPLTKEAKIAAFNEEGRMHMTVSLLVECHGSIVGGEQGAAELKQTLANLCQRLRLAGGTVTSVGQVQISGWPQDDGETRRIMRRLLPGFALLDRSALLAAHHSQPPQAEMLDAWLDFAALKMQADDGATPADGNVQWQHQPKPGAGYLVPLMTGYRAISPLCPPGEVANSRDNETPFRFTEAVYGVGEWRGLHRIDDLRHLLWRYHHQDEYYLCRSEETACDQDYPDDDEDDDINYN